MTASLLDAITEAGVTDRTVLDVGCGIGDLAIEVVTRGAASGTGYDLSAKAIEEARKLAAARGVGDRMRFEVGDGAKLELPAADIVVINRVVCCYPDTENLLEHTLGAAGSVFAMTAPVSNGRDRLAQPAVEQSRERRLPAASQEVRRVPNVHPRPRPHRRADPRGRVPARAARAASRRVGPRGLHALTRHERALRNSARISSSGRSSSSRPRSSSSSLNRS